jgi:hypothetical protein
MPANDARLMSVVDGSVAVEHAGGQDRYVAGENVLLPADTPCQLIAASPVTLLLTDRFSAA